MREPSGTGSFLWLGAIVIGLLLPTLSLIPLGSIWLWQRGYLLHWALATAVLVGIAFALQRAILKHPGMMSKPADTGNVSPAAAADPGWTPAEQQAWTDVLHLSLRVDVGRLTSRDAFLELGTETILAVARRLHPEIKEPLWQFTVPEVFALLERVSRRLGTFTTDHIPLSDRITVGNILALYRWRGALDVAEKAYGVWRLIRLVNPLTAATNEARERISKQMLEMGRTHVSQRLATAYVTEVGRAAIDLYGGRLRLLPEQLETTISRDTGAEHSQILERTVEPVRILIAGQVGAGKSSLVNALANEVQAAVDALPATSDFTAYELRQAGFPSAHLIDSPGIGAMPGDVDRLVAKACECDLILWVIPAHRADRQFEKNAIDAIQQAFARMQNRKPPPMVIILTHIDRLRPFGEWAPPYDLVSATQAKALSIREAVDTVAHELNFAVEDIVPVRLVHGAFYNIDALWSRMLMVLPDAQRSRLVRQLVGAKSNWNWRRVWSQAVNAGRVLGRARGSQ